MHYTPHVRAHRVFNPGVGYSAGAVAAAYFSKREWLTTIMLGWGVGGVYWGLFRVTPPPSYSIAPASAYVDGPSASLHQLSLMLGPPATEEAEADEEWDDRDFEDLFQDAH